MHKKDSTGTRDRPVRLAQAVEMLASAVIGIWIKTIFVDGNREILIATLYFYDRCLEDSPLPTVVIVHLHIQRRVDTSISSLSLLEECVCR